MVIIMDTIMADRDTEVLVTVTKDMDITVGDQGIITFTEEEAAARKEAMEDIIIITLIITTTITVEDESIKSMHWTGLRNPFGVLNFEMHT